ncbi:MAG: sulfotransferase [Bacteroidetes bacterium]|nr:sulfotransferase [Bacteroidota bacterium]
MKPNFLVAGVAKCGTTSLFYYLEQHPEVCIPKKETFFFIADFYKKPSDDNRGRREPSRIIFTKDQYDQLYHKCDGGAIGEVSTCYLHYYKTAIPQIKETLGDVPIIIVIRQPVARLISGYKHFIRLEKEDLSLEAALKEEPHRAELNWDFMWQYKGLGLYADGIAAFQNNFTRVKVILQEDLTDQPVATMQELFRFIGVNDTFTPDTSVKYNISDPQKNNLWFKYIFQNKNVKALLKPIANIFTEEKTRRKIMHKFRKPSVQGENKLIIDPELKEKLKNFYREDILKTQQLIQRDLSLWLK